MVMAKARSSPANSDLTITSDRASRLVRLVNLIGQKGQKREFLVQRLGVGLRDFYRDLDLLRKAGIDVQFSDGKYSLPGSISQSEELLPFPNPFLTLGEAEKLARGKTLAHQKLKDQISYLKNKPSRKKKRK